MKLRDIARRGELGPTIFVALRDLVTPARTSTTGAKRDGVRRFSREQLAWMIERAGGQCECPDCDHTGSAGGRCMALVDLPGVQFQGDHLVSWDEGGATDPTLNGAALCVVCNGKKGNREFTTAQLVTIAENRRAVAQRRR